jgi:hypothetical protein
MEKLKLVWFFLVGIYSYIHRGFQIYIYSIQGIASSLTLLLFKHDAVSIHIAGKWDISAQKAITYAIHLIIVLFLYFLLF